MSGGANLERFVERVHDHKRTPCADAVTLCYAQREKARQRAVLASGEEIAIVLPRGAVMRGGDTLISRSGRRISVLAAAEAVSTVVAASDLVRIAYHLGNRHVALQVGDGWVRYLRDRVLDEMVRGLGGDIVHESVAFEPEAGAYEHRH
ncbi:MAG: urease accessory protein UreE [Pseudomonadota bacterium]